MTTVVRKSTSARVAGRTVTSTWSGLPRRSGPAEALDEAVTDVPGVGTAYVVRDVGEVLLPVQDARAAQLAHAGGAAEEERVQVRTTVAVATDVAASDARQALDGRADRDHQPAHLRGEVVGQVGEVVVGARPEDQRDRELHPRVGEDPPLVAPHHPGVLLGRAGLGALAVGRVLAAA